MSQITIEKFYSCFKYVPMLLLTGEKINILSHKQTVDCPWNCVFTSSREEVFATAFSSAKRLCRNITQEDEIRGNMLDRHNLKIIRLFDTASSFDLPSTESEKRVHKKKGERFLSKITQMIEHTGHLVIDGFSENDTLSVDAICDLIAELREGTVMFFGFFDRLANSALNEICKEKNVAIFPQHLYEFLLPVESSDLPDDDLYEADSESKIEAQIYLNGKLHKIEEKSLQRISSFAKLLTKNNVMDKKIPPYLHENYFYSFMKDSSITPQWYGYKAGFYLKRYFDFDRPSQKEVSLLKKVRSCLQKPGRIEQKPILITGQSGSGKSVSIGALAYNIFLEAQFPIIFINKDSSIDFKAIPTSSNGNNSHRNSPQLEAIDAVIQMLEEKGAKSTLLIWDDTAFIREQKKYIDLYEGLKTRGRNIQLVCTAYEVLNAESSFDVEKIDIKLHPINQETNLNDSDDPENEIGRFRTILTDKAKINNDEVDVVLRYIQKETGGQNLMALFYTFFCHLRPGIIIGIQREAAKSMTEVLNYANILREQNEQNDELTPLERSSIMLAFKTAGFNITQSTPEDAADNNKSDKNIEDLLCLTAICSKFNLPIPSSLAFRISGAYDYDSISQIASIPFFECSDVTSGNFTYRIRTVLEANLLLSFYHITPEKEIKRIVQMISLIRGNDYYNQGVEVKLVADILYHIGPNAHNVQNDKKYANHYPKIIKALSDLRKERNIFEPQLVLQEITYMREFYTRFYKETENELTELEKKATIVSALRNAISIGDEALASMDKHYNLTIQDMLLVEIANSRIQLCEYDPVFTLTECARAKKDVMSIWKRNPGTSYSYTAWIKAAKKEYDNCQDEIEKAKLLTEMVNVIEQVRTEKLEVANDKYFHRPAFEVYSILETGEADKYFDELIQANSYAGLYIRAYKWLNEAKIDLRKRMTDDSQMEVCQKICAELLENPEYMLIVINSSECLYLLLRLKWLMYNKEPLFYKSSQYTYMNKEQWEEIKGICEQYKQYFIDSNIADGHIAISILYTLTLSYAQLEDYTQCFKIIRILRKTTEWWSNHKTRIKNRYFICDESGTPQEFDGEITVDVTPNNNQGYIQIYKISPFMLPAQKDIYYHKHNLKDTVTDRGTVYTDFQLGSGYMGFSVYRGLKGGSQLE